MIIVKFIGGLGNQMFQYAFYRSLSEKYLNVKADLTGFNNYNLHDGYLLENVFNIKVKAATKNEINKVRDDNKNITSKARRKIFGRIKKHIKEEKFSKKYEINSDVYLDGYWQNINYFKDVDKIIRNDFTFCPMDKGIYNNEIDKINNTESVSIHIRRGDYLQSNIHKNLGANYYLAAVDYINDIVINPRYYIFSDDIKWVTQHYSFLKDACFMIHKKDTKPHHDMQLMSMCKHNIIANSTYSWWAAWLNSNHRKIIIAPQKWFSDSWNFRKQKTDNPYISEWILLPNAISE